MRQTNRDRLREQDRLCSGELRSKIKAKGKSQERGSVREASACGSEPSLGHPDGMASVPPASTRHSPNPSWALGRWEDSSLSLAAFMH